MKKQLLSILLIGVLVIGLTGCGKSNKDRMVDYLKSIDFKCEEDEDGIIICAKKNDNSELEIMQIGMFYETKKDFDKVQYRIIVDDLYTLGVNSWYYDDIDDFHEPFYSSEEPNFVCHYRNENDILKIGENVVLYKGGDECEKSLYTEKVNEMLRKFEKYYQEAGVQLGK